MKKNAGFTLVELMVVVVMIAIIAAIAIPSYQVYVRKNKLAIAKQYMLCVATEMDKFKAKNFSYKGYNLSKASSAANAAACKTVDGYNFSLVDASSEQALDAADSTVYGLNWALKAQSSDTQNFNLLLTSNGVQCQNKTFANISYTSCGTDGAENWK